MNPEEDLLPPGIVSPA